MNLDDQGMRDLKNVLAFYKKAHFEKITGMELVAVGESIKRLADGVLEFQKESEDAVQEEEKEEGKEE